MNWLSSKISRNRLDRLISGHASHERTLEVGAYGRPSYGTYFPNRIGIDIKPGPGVDIVASVYELPFTNGEFDVVLCMSVLEHLEEPAKAIIEMRRVLRPGGQIIVSVPFLFPIHDAPGDYWRFTKYGLRYLFHDGWQIQELKAETTAQESLAVLLQRFAYQTRMHLNSILKFCFLLKARMLAAMPSIFTAIFGDIHKKVPEPDAFASAFFLVAKKIT